MALSPHHSHSHSRAPTRTFWLKAGVFVSAFVLACGGLAAKGGELDHTRDTISHFLHIMPRTVRADHPAILPVAAAIMQVTSDPLEQLVMVNDVTHLLVDYDEDLRVYGQSEYHATLDEMLARRQQGGWLYLRDDCDGRAVFAAHILAALGLSWRLEASSWKEHAWVVARVNGCDYDLLDLRRHQPELKRLSYRLFGHFFTVASHPPPSFDWRRAWAERTSENLELGLRLGLLTLDSRSHHWRERHATDWTVVAPAEHSSPFDPRTLTAMYAGFPFGEPLTTGMLAVAPLPQDPPRGKGKVSALSMPTDDFKGDESSEAKVKGK